MNKSDYPLITIGITTFNNISTHFDNEDVLKRGLDCFVNQDYPNFEIFIQDDCSTDRSFEICKEYAKRYPFIKAIQNKQNLGADLNIGNLVAKVNGDFFIWGCVDDFYERDYLSKCYAKLKTQSMKSVCQSYIKTIYPDKEVIDQYEDIAPPVTTEERLELNQILFHREKYLGKCSALNPIIHGLIRIKSARVIFCNPPLLYFELALPILLIWFGGICVVEEVLFVNEAKQPFADRYPQSEYVKNTTNKYFLVKNSISIMRLFLRLYMKKDINTRFLFMLNTWYELLKIYFLNIYFQELKESLFKYLSEYFPLLISIYRFFKKKLQH